MSEKKWTSEDMSAAVERALQTMEGVALELYRRGREPLLEELETVKRERDEARAEVERLKRISSDEVRGMTLDQVSDLVVAESLWTRGYRLGAEAMREACAVALMADGLVLSRERAANVVRALPIPEEP